MARDCPSEGCIVRGITRYAEVPRSTSASDEDKKHALMFLVHFVGDLHQPLHAGNKEDKGGNSIQAEPATSTGSGTTG